MQFEMCALPGGGKLELYLRSPDPAMPNALRRPLVLVVPGGGYEHVSAREADPVALQFAAAGYHAAVLTYSVGEGARDYQPLRQLRAAIGLLRQNAERWSILPDRIAVCGFSAGGHLALSGAVLDCPGEAADRSRKPDAVLLAYPVITAGEYAHRGSFVQLSGSEDRAEHQRFGLEGKITPDTPPVFVWHTMEDATVPVENTLLLLAALRKNHVPCEAHLFEKGVHGRGGCRQRPPRPLGAAGGGMAERHLRLPSGINWICTVLQKIHEKIVDLQQILAYTGKRKQTPGTPPGRKREHLWQCGRKFLSRT